MKPITLSKKYAHLRLTEDLCASILDSFPHLIHLKAFHTKFLLNPALRCNPSLAIKLMRAYSARGLPTYTRHVFDQVSDKNTVFFNVMMRSYINNAQYANGITLFIKMHSLGFVPDNYTYPCALKACASSKYSHVGLQIHTCVVKSGLDSNLFVGNGLVSMYGKCRLLVDAKNVLDEMPQKDVVSWNSMVAGYAQSGNFDAALEICRKMEGAKVKADCGTMASLFPAVTNTKMENVAYVREIFEKMKRRSLVSWNVMIAVYVNNSMPKEAVDVYSSIESFGMVPDSVSAASVLPACGDLSALSIGRRIHELVDRKKMLPNLLVENALIDMYAKCGCVEEAKRVFDGMKVNDVVSWTSMVAAYGISGEGEEAVRVFNEMRRSGVSPDSIAFVSALAACSHSGLLKEGEEIFDLMEEYKVEPTGDHFACLVDLLGRAGKIKEAYQVVKRMPMEPIEKVWGALLGACRLHNELGIGVIAADRLFEISPEPSGYYVLLSNMYAKLGKWEEVARVRSAMEEKGVRKKAGISNVEVKGKVYTFMAGDKSNWEWEAIYEKLEAMVGRMREIGYVPETESALHDVDEEEKESHLAVHSEKLAIVFAMMKTEGGSSIRITKNLRVCRDCHVALKYMSLISRRMIVVRDNHRFHYFHRGACSCGDYW